MDKNNEFISAKINLEKEKEDKNCKSDNNIEDRNNNNKINQNDTQDINEENNKEKNKEENKDKINNTIKKKIKGYVRIFRKIIKNKNVLLKSIIRKRFKEWKDKTLKDCIFKKKITIRISVSKSKDKDKKERFGSEEKSDKKYKKINDYKYKKINSFLKNSNTSSSLLNKSKYKQSTTTNNINNINWKTDNSTIMSPRINKEPKKLIYSKFAMSPNHIKEKIKLTDIKKDKAKEKSPTTFKTPLNTKKKKLFYSNSSLSNKTTLNNSNSNYRIKTIVSPINKEKKVYNNTKVGYINKTNNKHPLTENNDKRYKKITVNLNHDINKNKNIQRTFDRKNLGNINYKKIYKPNQSYKNINNSSYKREEIKKIIKPYNTNKYMPLSKNVSSKKIEENYTTLKKIYLNKNDSFLRNPKNGSYTDYNNKTFNREHRISSPIRQYDQKSLKKGITTVIQHYSNIKEEFNDYDIKSARTQI